MMVAYENHCVGCTVLGLNCVGSYCGNLRVPVFYCDNRECIANTEGADGLFNVDGKQLCLDCVMDIADRTGIDPEDIIESEVEI